MALSEYARFMMELRGYDLYKNNEKMYKHEVFSYLNIKSAEDILHGDTIITAKKIDRNKKYKFQIDDE